MNAGARASQVKGFQEVSRLFESFNIPLTFFNISLNISLNISFNRLE